MSKPAPAATADDLAVRYRVEFPAPHTHLFHVTVTVPFPEPRATVDLALPGWTPGSYRVRDFSRHVQDLESRAPLRKLDKQTWRFETAGARSLEVTYKVYANELTVRTAHLDERHAYWNGANLCLYVVGEKDRPARLEVGELPAGWRIVTGLDPVPDSVNAFTATTYDLFIDQPVDAGPLAVEDFEVEGVRHRIAMDGAGNYEIARLRDDVARIVRSELAMWGGRPPYPHYTFIVHCVPEGVPGGGLEHERSTTLMWNRFKFRPRDKYEDFLALVSHEFFHLWNVKRLRPRELGPFEYGQENYTRALWIVEGVTSYYDELFLRRAGIWDADAYLRKTADHVQNVEETPGRRHQSLEDASFDAWIKYYQKNEHSVNATISYYEKGQLVAWLLDLEVRARSRGERSLDDVMRSLYREFPETGPGYTTERFEALASEAAGSDLGWFFADYVRGVKELDYDKHLAPFGLRLAWEPKSREAGAAPAPAISPAPPAPPRAEPETRASLGARVRAEGAKSVINEVLEGSAAWSAGLQANDELLAIDGFKTGHDHLEARLHEHRPGDKVRVTVFRGDRLVEAEAVLDGKPWAKAMLQRRPEAGEAEKRMYEGWVGEAWKAIS